jgi:tetratricopeptide (TPR) repeat protein
MGAVFRARSPEGSFVAIKVLSSTNPAARARFERERRLLASFGAADGFVPYLDGGEAPQGPFLVMPFLEGGTLRSRLAKGPLGVEETVAVGRALAAALGRAHARGVVHRDLKPENVLFGADGQPLVADLGLAKHFDRSASGGQSVSLSVSGVSFGTAGYMSPEQIQDAKSVGPPADVFALGAILYECLSGRPAFEGESYVEVASKASEARFPPLSTVASDAPSWLVSVVGRALERSPGARFPDGLALGRALARDSKEEAPPRRWLAPALVLAGIAAIGGGVAVLRGGPAHGGPAPGQAVREDASPKTPATPTKDPGAEELAAESERRSKRRDFAGAVEEATRAIARDARCERAWVARAQARVNKADFDRAIEDASRAIEIDPRDARAWLYRGQARYRRGAPDFAGALEDLTRAIELDPGIAAAWNYRGIVLATQGSLDAAIADQTRAIALDDRLAHAWQGRGAARALKGDVEGALADLTAAIERDADLGDAWFVRAGLRQNAGDDRGAIEDFTRAIELATGNLPLAFLNRGFARLNTGDRDGAAADYRRYLELAPDDEQAPQIRDWLANNPDAGRR